MIGSFESIEQDEHLAVSYSNNYVRFTWLFVLAVFTSSPISCAGSSANWAHWALPASEKKKRNWDVPLSCSRVPLYYLEQTKTVSQLFFVLVFRLRAIDLLNFLFIYLFNTFYWKLSEFFHPCIYLEFFHYKFILIFHINTYLNTPIINKLNNACKFL